MENKNKNKTKIKTAFSAYRTWETQKSVAKKNGTNSYLSYEDVCYTEEAVKSGNLNELLVQTSNTIKKYANSKYKIVEMIEPSEIEKIKMTLNSFVTNDEKAEAFKNEIINDLAEFQDGIKNKYLGTIESYQQKLQWCEDTIVDVTKQKNEHIKEQLAKIAWPYDKKTQECDTTIARLKLEYEQYSQKLENELSMRPAANKKDMLVFDIKLKEKYAKMELIFA